MTKGGKGRQREVKRGKERKRGTNGEKWRQREAERCQQRKKVSYRKWRQRNIK